MRPPELVMRLERMGAAFQTRLSFMRCLIRRMHDEHWRIDRYRFELDDEGYGTAVYRVRTPQHSYSLVAFSHRLDPDKRTDRVIAEAWDATFALFDGCPTPEDIQRMGANVPLQEAGRCRPSELVLSRANKSLRLFDSIVKSLAAGRQPEVGTLAQVGYLMRTTAVYGNGKYGIADRAKIVDRPELSGPFQAEMLAVYLIRQFTLDLVEHVARSRSPSTFVPLQPALKRHLGIGNATGLGMAPFLIAHPVLIHHWMHARETALARVRGLTRTDADGSDRFLHLLTRARRHVHEWRVDDARQSRRIDELETDLARLFAWLDVDPKPLHGDRPWDRIYLWAEAHLSIEAQELVVSLLLETHPSQVDDLASTLAAGQSTGPLNPAETVAELRAALAEDYGWALSIDFSDPERQRLFWYVSEDKLEPRVGDRFQEPGVDKEQPLGIAREVQRLNTALAAEAGSEKVAELLMRRPDLRHVVRRVQIARRYPYAEIRDNLLDTACLPIDLLRCKLAFFGASKFDPKSDRWTRITLFQGAPLPDELDRPDADDWCFPVMPRIEAGTCPSTKSS
jgi:hypothetical protein